jgi:hypothetical protein
MIRVSKGWLAVWRMNGKGPDFVKLGNSRTAHVRYPLEKVKEWLVVHESSVSQSVEAALNRL